MGATGKSDKAKEKKRQDVELGLGISSRGIRKKMKSRVPKAKYVSGSLVHTLTKGTELLLTPVYEQFAKQFKEHQVTPLDINSVACDPTTSFYGRLDKHVGGCHYNAAPVAVASE